MYIYIMFRFDSWFATPILPSRRNCIEKKIFNKRFMDYSTLDCLHRTQSLLRNIVN